ncbi:LysR family transcriptional regulator [Pseudonocardia kongjuensis]|uniref:LysR family transcriptional regulator n=1 Tax=Pseudonocardia kongjuensis TaxID=102227 RepID=A0ABN1XJY1_9PSEU
MGNPLDTRQLVYFLGVVDHGGFGRAAEALHVSQPSLSQAIKQLERQLDTDLFHRVGRGVQLTEPGRQLVGPARRVLRDLETARAAVLSTRELERGTVEIVSMPSPGIEPLTTLIRAFHERHPAMTTTVAAAFTPGEVVHAVHSGSAEIGLLGASGRPHTGELVVLPLERQPFVLISPPGTTPDTPVSRSDLAGLDVVISHRGSLMRQMIDDVLAAGAPVRVVAEVAHRTSLLPLVLAGVGHSVVPESWRELALRAGCTVRRIEPQSCLDVALVHRPDGLTPGARAFADLAAAHVATDPADG